MNPELLRNAWLEFTPRHVALTVAFLALVFFAVAATNLFSPSSAADILYYMIVVLWGSRNAALSVVGEIRERTWDGQRLSSLAPGTLVWGKLFGPTIGNWFGGAICLALILVDAVSHHGAATALIELIYYIGIGIVAQAAAFLASLIAIRRRLGHSGFEIFLYQLAGLAAAGVVYWVWDQADPAISLLGHKPAVDFILWWGAKLDARVFLLASLAIFAGWTLVGCYRAMRLELKMRNGPAVWLAFLLFAGIYVAEFDAWLSPDLKNWDVVALRLLLAGWTFAVLTYVMVLLEPKDRVHYRWMEGHVAQGRLGKALSGVQAWMMSYAATVALAVALCLWLTRVPAAAQAGQPTVLAAIGFLTRDVALFVLMQTLPGRRRGDAASVAILFALYVLAPAILMSLQANGLLLLFYPQPQAPSWIGVAAAWIEGLAVAGAALGRLALSEREARASRA